MDDWTTEVSAQWTEGMGFTGRDQRDRELKMDALPDYGKGDGFLPMELLIMGMAGCTGMDIVWILDKKKQKMEGMEVKVKAKRRDKAPQIYTHIHLEFTITGDIDEKAVDEAIRLSMDKYCSAGAMLKTEAEITTSYKIKRG